MSLLGRSSLGLLDGGAKPLLARSSLGLLNTPEDDGSGGIWRLARDLRIIQQRQRQIADADIEKRTQEKRAKAQRRAIEARMQVAIEEEAERELKALRKAAPPSAQATPETQVDYRRLLLLLGGAL